MPRSASARWAARVGLACLSSLALAVGVLAVSTPAQAATTNPFSPAYGHLYRHGAVPTRATNNQMRAYQSAHPDVVPNAASNLNYGGGVDGIGVTTGAPRVYLVFWGSQWGSSGTDGNGNTTLSGDPSGMAPRVQQLMKGLGVNNELWSGVMTQYCEGVSAGSQTCPASAAHVGYPTGGAYAGIWADTSTAAPSSANGNQIGTEAVKAASHFGNTTAAANRNAQYVIVSPTGTTPDGFNAGGNFCAWHDWNGDSTLTGGAVSSSVGDVAFTNLPYITDAGSSCGQGFVNSPGTLDGVTIVEGHEYAETITDQNPAGGWTDSTGAENGDKCAWVSSGAGASANVAFSTGTFAMQTTWSNDVVGCQMSHAIVGGGTSAVTVTNPGSRTGTVGTATSLTLTASGGTGSYSWSATGLPPGLSINSSTGVISGTPTTAGTYTVTATATSGGQSGNTTFTWTINPGGGTGVTVTNPGSQTGTVGAATSLTLTASGGTGSYSWSATGLPPGLSINSSTGVISGTPTTAGTYTVTATATSGGQTGNATFSWTINPGSSGCASPGQKLRNPGFESGNTVWSSTAGVIGQNGPYEPAHSGSWDAWLDGYGTTHTDTLSQSVSIPAGCTHYTFSFYLHIDTAETTTTVAYDKLTVKIGSTTLATYSNLDHNSGYSLHSFNVASFAGQTVTINFTGSEDYSLQTSFVLDDTALSVS